MENFLKAVGGVEYVKKYLSRLKEDGVESVEDLQYLEDQDYNEMGFKRLHKRKIMKAVIESHKASAAPRSTIKQETNESSLEEKVEREKNWKTLKKLHKGLSGLFSPKRLSELEAFVRRDIDKGTTLAALQLVHGQASYLKQLLIKTKLEISTKQAACHTFFSHVQKYAGDLCRSLSLELGLIGIDVWYDMDAERLDSRGMIEGIHSSTYFMLVATKEYFERPWPVFEALVANIFNKPILVLLESDSRRGGLTFEDFTSILPDPWASLKSHEFLKVERRGSFWKATVDELRKRLSKTPAIYNYIGWEQERASKSDAVEALVKEDEKDDRKEWDLDTDAAMLQSIITLVEPPKQMDRSRNDLVGLELVQPEDAAQALAEKMDRSDNFGLELEPIQPEDTAKPFSWPPSSHTLYRPWLFLTGKKPLVQQNQEKGINKNSPPYKVRESAKRKMIIEEELRNEEKTDMLPTESKSNQHEKGRRIRTDSELIHHMLYLSDSTDSFDCL